MAFTLCECRALSPILGSTDFFYCMSKKERTLEQKTSIDGENTPIDRLLTRSVLKSTSSGKELKNNRNTRMSNREAREEYKDPGRDNVHTGVAPARARNSPRSASTTLLVPANTAQANEDTDPIAQPIRLYVPKTPDSPALGPMALPSPAPSPLHLPAPVLAARARRGADGGRERLRGVRSNGAGAGTDGLRPSSRARQAARSQGAVPVPKQDGNGEEETGAAEEDAKGMPDGNKRVAGPAVPETAQTGAGPRSDGERAEDRGGRVRGRSDAEGTLFAPSSHKVPLGYSFAISPAPSPAPYAHTPSTGTRPSSARGPPPLPPVAETSSPVVPVQGNAAAPVFGFPTTPATAATAAPLSPHTHNHGAAAHAHDHTHVHTFVVQEPVAGEDSDVASTATAPAATKPHTHAVVHRVRVESPPMPPPRHVPVAIEPSSPPSAATFAPTLAPLRAPQATHDAPLLQDIGTASPATVAVAEEDILEEGAERTVTDTEQARPLAATPHVRPVPGIKAPARAQLPSPPPAPRLQPRASMPTKVAVSPKAPPPSTLPKEAPARTSASPARKDTTHKKSGSTGPAQGVRQHPPPHMILDASSAMASYGPIAPDVLTSPTAPSPVTRLVPLRLPPRGTGLTYVTDISSPLSVPPHAQTSTGPSNTLRHVDGDEHDGERRSEGAGAASKVDAREGLSRSSAPSTGAGASVSGGARDRHASASGSGSGAAAHAPTSPDESRSGGRETSELENAGARRGGADDGAGTVIRAMAETHEGRTIDRAIVRPLHADDAEGYYSPIWVDQDNNEEDFGRSHDSGHAYSVLGGNSLLDTLEGLQEAHAEEVHREEEEDARAAGGAVAGAEEEADGEDGSEADKSSRRHVSIAVGEEGLSVAEEDLCSASQCPCHGPIYLEVQQMHNAVDEAVSAAVSAIVQVCFVVCGIGARVVRDVASVTQPFFTGAFATIWQLVVSGATFVARTPLGDALRGGWVLLWGALQPTVGPVLRSARAWAAEEVQMLYYIDKRRVLRVWDVCVGAVYLGALLAINVGVDALRLACLAVKSVLALPLLLHWIIISAVHVIRRAITGKRHWGRPLASRGRGVRGHVVRGPPASSSSSSSSSSSGSNTRLIIQPSSWPLRLLASAGAAVYNLCVRLLGLQGLQVLVQRPGEQDATPATRPPEALQPPVAVPAEEESGAASVLLWRGGLWVLEHALRLVRACVVAAVDYVAAWIPLAPKIAGVLGTAWRDVRIWRDERVYAARA